MKVAPGWHTVKIELPDTETLRDERGMPVIGKKKTEVKVELHKGQQSDEARDH